MADGENGESVVIIPGNEPDDKERIRKINGELGNLFDQLKPLWRKYFAVTDAAAGADRRLFNEKAALARQIIVICDAIIKKEEELRMLAGSQLLRMRRELAESGRASEKDGGKDRKFVGEVRKVAMFLEGDRARVSDFDDEHSVVKLSPELIKLRDGGELKTGDDVLEIPGLTGRSFIAAEKLPKTETADWLIEDIPMETFADIGGLERQIQRVKDEIFLPYLTPERFSRYKTSGAKGILLEGPPGCGKTLIARALANELSRFVKERTGKDVRAKFFAINGPELIHWFVGRTEHNIRELFRRAKESAPSFIFIDEVESLVPARGSGISSDIEKTIVPQFLALMQGIEERGDVIVIGATNRKDLIDPAILRSGRFDLKINVDRPDKWATAKIFGKYLSADLPLARQYFDEANYDGHYYIPRNRKGKERKIRYRTERRPEKIIGDYLVPLAVKRIFDPHKKVNKLLRIEYADGERETFYFKDLISGAMVKGIVDRAKKAAIKREEESGGKNAGLFLVDLYRALEEEFRENQDVPQSIEAFKQWLVISGKKRQDVKDLEILVGKKKEKKRRLRIGFQPSRTKSPK